MDHATRIAEHEANVAYLYALKIPLIRQGKDRKKVEEYLAMAEEILAINCDMERAESKLKFCDTDTQRGQNQHSEYTRMIEQGKKRIEELTPRHEKLKAEFGLG